MKTSPFTFKNVYWQFDWVNFEDNISYWWSAHVTKVGLYINLELEQNQSDDKMKSLIIISAFAILSAAGVAGSAGCCSVKKIFSKKVLNYIDLNGECFVDKRNKGRILPFRAKSVSPKSLTIEKCKKACFEDNDYVYAGVQAGNRCFCGNATPTSRASSESECNKKCRGDKSQICGGKLRMNIYVNKG